LFTGQQDKSLMRDCGPQKPTANAGKVTARGSSAHLALLAGYHSTGCPVT